MVAVMLANNIELRLVAVVVAVLVVVMVVVLMLAIEIDWDLATLVGSMYVSLLSQYLIHQYYKQYFLIDLFFLVLSFP